MDLLIAMGTSAAFFLSLSQIILTPAGQPPVLYFEAAAAIVTLVLMGKWLENRAKRGTTESIRMLMALKPDMAWVDRNGTFVEVASQELIIEDRLLVKPGERIAVDGTILRGQTELDQSHITGESLPVSRGVGDDVFGGAINGAASFEMEATKLAQDSLISRVIALVESAQSGKAKVQRLVDRLSAIFVPTVIAIAIITFLGWIVAGYPIQTALITSVSVLVIACPCALGLATPTALVAGMGAAARSGILIHDIEALEATEAIDTIAFDKTGTLTQGRPDVIDLWAQDGDAQNLLRLSAAVQQESEHLIAHTILDAAEDKNIALPAATGITIQVGEGVVGNIEGKKVAVGNQALMDRVGAKTTGVDLPKAPMAASSIRVAVDETIIGALFIADKTRAETPLALQGLKQRHIETVMLTGDAAAVAEAIASKIGIDRYEAELKPDDKVATIHTLQAQGKKVAMVGDGINDAPALAAADLGIAMGTGTDIAIETADIALMRPDPRLVADALSVSEATRRKIKQNLVWAFLYNTIALPVAALGFLSPMIAAAAMAFSSVSVVTNSLMLRRWKAQAGKTQ